MAAMDKRELLMGLIDSHKNNEFIKASHETTVGTFNDPDQSAEHRNNASRFKIYKKPTDLPEPSGMHKKQNSLHV